MPIHYDHGLVVYSHATLMSQATSITGPYHPLLLSQPSQCNETPPLINDYGLPTDHYKTPPSSKGK